MKIAAVHGAPVMLDLTASIASAVKWIQRASSDGVDLIGFPETFLPGFPHWINMVPPAAGGVLFKKFFRNSVASEDISTTLAPITQACKSRSVSAVIGFSERQSGTLFNSLAFIDRQTGTVELVRRKLVPTSAERAVWGYGDASTLHAVQLDGTKVSGMMCFEHTMQLARHALSEEGSDIHVAAWPSLGGIRGYQEIYKAQVSALITSYALMSQAFVVSSMSPFPEDSWRGTVDVVGDTGLVTPSDAWSAIIDPFGRVIAEYEGVDEQLLATEIDVGLRIDAKRLLDNGHFGRSECFQLHVNRTPFSRGSVVDSTDLKLQIGSTRDW